MSQGPHQHVLVIHCKGFLPAASGPRAGFMHTQVTRRAGDVLKHLASNFQKTINENNSLCTSPPYHPKMQILK